jgi:hypothetical protein
MLQKVIENRVELLNKKSEKNENEIKSDRLFCAFLTNLTSGILFLKVSVSD